MRDQVNQEVPDDLVARRVGFPDDLAVVFGDPEAVFGERFVFGDKRAREIALDPRDVHQAQHSLRRHGGAFQRVGRAGDRVFIAGARGIHRGPEAVVVRAEMPERRKIVFPLKMRLGHKAVARLAL